MIGSAAPAADTLNAVGMTAMEGDAVARQVELVDGTTAEAGTVAEAAALCGVSERTYRAYERVDKSPLSGVPAPGAFEARDPTTGEVFVARDPATGATLRNLDAVRAWMAARSGPRRPRTVETLRATPWRRALLEHAAAGRLGDAVAWGELAMPGPGGATAPARRAARVAQAAAELAALGLLARTESGGYSITNDGRSVLSRFQNAMQCPPEESSSPSRGIV